MVVVCTLPEDQLKERDLSCGLSLSDLVEEMDASHQGEYSYEPDTEFSINTRYLYHEAAAFSVCGESPCLQGMVEGYELYLAIL